LTLAAAIALLVAPILFRMVLVNKYVEGLAVMPLTMVGCVWFGLLAIANNYLWCREKAWMASVAVSCGLVANAALNYCWLPRWGLSGAVAATAVANLAALAIVLILSQRLGMNYRRITCAAMGLPLTLCAGPLVALSLVLFVVFLGLSRGWLLQPDDWARARGWWSARTARRLSTLDG
jgi:O-antigen/teichoic acid export membrane protein